MIARRYVAVMGQDVGTCDALRWAWLSVRPMILATADTEEEALSLGIERCGHDDVVVVATVRVREVAS